ncbi:TetR/AcrR family transcriptional regulator [Streptomyces pluripotens]|uniref:TetR/AcrR family transcriptional regulator n=1 Tax=Streptomyces pluripotens TaxID=1355015 RepID=A0A221P734_9ACTN|nr:MULTISPECIES: TetR/AcrR family transcriptional regulator [Streptomyces]ARP73558.1 TetR family transcriptional regulator [Streptomyces pluripotens]ASN27808.1 TetR/AcrR family transcriptional regulator [Streptomyces pluripotens]KIE26791.1 TetR family transcriptional regulator [Streptomyces sp. MUSC 125]MCH0557256.1 TetR/AcrR family transcriptional regulator [Streptomyces sp. MUM 16J]
MSADTTNSSLVSGRRAAKRSSATALKVLNASKTLFLQDGYDGVNLDRIATRAGVARQTVYNLFGSKEAVFRATMEHHWAAFGLEELLARLDRDVSRVDPADFLRRFADMVLTFVAETDQVSFTRLVIAESRRLPWIAEEFYRLGKAPLAQTFTACLREMSETGVIDCPHPELAARQFLGLIQEFVIWPQVMAIGPDVMKLPPTDLVVEEAIAMFLSRYMPTGTAA